MIEIASPLSFSDITCLCRVSKNGLVASCCVCGAVVTSGVHLCEVAYGGFWCSRCCPACNGQVELTEAESEAMERNRLLSIHGALLRKRDGARAVPWIKPSRSVYYKDHDFVVRRAVVARFRPDSQRGVLWSLIPASGIEYVHLCRLSPFGEKATWLILRRLDRVLKAVSVRRVG